MKRLTPDEIKAARAAADMTIEEFAHHLMVSARTVSRWESGECKCTDKLRTRMVQKMIKPEG